MPIEGMKPDDNVDRILGLHSALIR